jgi:pyruvate kinase
VRPDAPEAGFELALELKAEGYFGDSPTPVIIVSGQQPGIIGTTDTIKVRILE